jgi:RNA polymerase sigma-70 factor, ECF subfamily
VPREALQVCDDLELVRLIGCGDEAAFRLLVDREARYLYGVAHALAGNAEDAEDLVQETFASVLNGRFRGEASVRTWLVGILVRRAAMLRRSHRRRHGHRPLDAGTAEAAAAEMATSSETAGTEARLDLSVMLQSLSAEHRAVIVLRELQGLTYEEIAATLRVPMGTVESRLHRAREELRRRFWGYL